MLVNVCLALYCCHDSYSTRCFQLLIQFRTMQQGWAGSYLRLFTIYIFTRGTKIGKGGTSFGCQSWSGQTNFGGGPIFLLQASHSVYAGHVRVFPWLTQVTDDRFILTENFLLTCNTLVIQGWRVLFHYYIELFRIQTSAKSRWDSRSSCNFVLIKSIIL